MSLSFVRSGEHNGSGWLGQVLAGEAVPDRAVEESALGIGLEKLVVAGRRHAVVEVAFPAMELNLEAARGSLITDPGEQRRFQPDAHPRFL
jgi:hypothetical protein